MYWLARKKCPRLKCWDVYTNINNNQPILSYYHFPQGISLFICGICPKLMNALEPLRIFLCDFTEHLNQYFYSVQMKISYVQIDPNISKKFVLFLVSLFRVVKAFSHIPLL